MRAETFATPALFVAEIVTQTDGDDFSVVISDVNCIDEGTLSAVVPVLQSRASRGWIAATMSSSTPSPMIELLLPLFTHTVTVPALRYRIEDIEVLVPFLLRELTSGADVRLAADAMRQLSKLPPTRAGMRIAGTFGLPRSSMSVCRAMVRTGMPSLVASAATVSQRMRSSRARSAQERWLTTYSV